MCVCVYHICMYMFVYIYIYINMRVYICAYVYVSLFFSLSLPLPLPIYIYSYMHLCKILLIHNVYILNKSIQYNIFVNTTEDNNYNMSFIDKYSNPFQSYDRV